MGIVVPAGILTNPRSPFDRSTRQFIKDKFQILAIVSIPHFAFRKAGSNVKTNLFFLRKLSEGQKNEANTPIFMAVAKHIGYDATGRPDTNDLPDIAKKYKEFLTKILFMILQFLILTIILLLIILLFQIVLAE